MRSFIAPLAEPLAILWTGLLVVAVWHVWKGQWRRAVLPVALCVILSVVGSTSLPARLLASLERPYAGVGLEEAPEADAIVMLGGVLGRSRNDPFQFDAVETFDRVLTATELARLGKGRVLVLGGSGPRLGESGPPEGELLKAWLERWNVPGVPVVHLGACLNTRVEAQRVAVLAKEHGWKRIILVTSASHMRRSEGLFRRLGIPVTPVACDFAGMAALEAPPPFSPFPRLVAFDLLERYLHEGIGWWVYRLRGWVEEG